MMVGSLAQVFRSGSQTNLWSVCRKRPGAGVTPSDEIPLVENILSDREQINDEDRNGFASAAACPPFIADMGMGALLCMCA